MSNKIFLIATMLAAVAMAAGGLTACHSNPATFSNREAQATLSAWKTSPTEAISAVTFKLEPGNRIYWKNPGDIGRATSFELQLPPGIEADPLTWPVPEAFEQGEGAHGIGYSGEVVLVRRLHGAVENKNITAEVDWVACSSVCVPGNATLTSPISDESQSESEWFKRWSARVPRSIQAWPAEVVARVDDKGGMEFQLNDGTLQWLPLNKIDSPDWFSPAAASLRVPAAHFPGVLRLDRAGTAIGYELQGP